MLCYMCGSVLPVQKGDVCPACGANVRNYRRVVSFSNLFYNEGLEKAQVRNMTGAIESLRQSIRLCKDNIEARNLLGLVYYECGEVVAALSEWVISKNLAPDDNPVDGYLDAVRDDPVRLEDLSATAHKFNIALGYCRQRNLDLAVIQVKKILSMNPGYVKAHLLLALLYLENKNPTKAKAEASKALALDTGSVLGARYLKEAQAMLLPGEESSKNKGMMTPVRYQSGNETIIQPAGRARVNFVVMAASLAAGCALGIAAAVYLILPARVQNLNGTNQQKIAAISEESDAKSAMLAEYEQQNLQLTTRLESMGEELDTLKNSVPDSTSADILMKAAARYMSDPEDTDGVAEIMRDYDHEEVRQSRKKEAGELYESLMSLVGEQLTAKAYNDGYSAYRREDYETAVDELSRAYAYDAERADALFYLGDSYYRMGDIDSAKETFSKVMRSFPDTEEARNAEAKLAEINNA